jgi:ribosomal-protein-alanine N-acetyltransferase
MDFFPEITTTRLKLRKLCPEDIPSLVNYAGNKKISDEVLNIPHPYQEFDAVFRISYVVQGFKNKTRYIFAIVLKETDELIGEVSLHSDDGKRNAELGYWVGEPFWNQGFATEATTAVIKFGFETLELRKIYSTCRVQNEASVKVLLKNGMTMNKVNGSVAFYSLTKEQSQIIVDRINS